MAGVRKKSFVVREHSLKSLIGIAEEQVGQTLCMSCKPYAWGVFIEEEDACR